MKKKRQIKNNNTKTLQTHANRKTNNCKDMNTKRKRNQQTNSKDEKKGVVGLVARSAFSFGGAVFLRLLSVVLLSLSSLVNFTKNNCDLTLTIDVLFFFVESKFDAHQKIEDSR